MTTSGSSARTAAANAIGGLEELVHVEDAILEQVAEPPAGADELDSMASLDVLREDEDAHLRVQPPDLDRGQQALVLVARRHAHVDDREVGLMLGDDGEQCRGIADPREHRVAGVLQQPREAFAEQAIR